MIKTESLPIKTNSQYSTTYILYFKFNKS